MNKIFILKESSLKIKAVKIQRSLSTFFQFDMNRIFILKESSLKIKAVKIQRSLSILRLRHLAGPLFTKHENRKLNSALQNVAV
jgi:hypothetical protein